MTRVGVVGCGITGIALTHYLAERGASSITFEAADQPGGVIESTRREGVVLEHGPQRIRVTDPVRDLIEAAGLTSAVIEADDSLPLYVYARGALRRVPFSVAEFVTTDLLSFEAKARVLAEPATAPGRGDETAAALFARKFGEEAYENLVGPLFGGIYGSDPNAMPAKYALEGLLELEDREGSLLIPAVERALNGDRAPPISFTQGLQQLPATLADRHTDRIELGCPVAAIEEDGEEYRIVTDRRDVPVEQVVVTTPADVAADLLANVAPNASALADLAYNPLALVHLRSDVDADGFGYQVRAGEGLHTLGVSWNASLFDRDGLYTCFLGGMRDPEIVERGDRDLGELARDEFAAVMDADAEVCNVTRLDRGFPAYDRSWEALEAVTLPDGVHLATNYTARMGVPSRIREARRLADTIAKR